MQYRVDLFSAALEEDLGNTSLGLADRRAHLEEYHSRWDRYNQEKVSFVELPPHAQRVIDGEVLACIQEAVGDKIDVTFIRLPSVSRGIQRKQWIVRGLPKNGSDLKMNPGLDILVVPELLDGGRWVTAFSTPLRCRSLTNSGVCSAFQIHLLRLSDGRPHPLATVDPSVFHIDYGEGKTITEFSVLIGERILVAVVAVHKALRWKDGGILIWDWRNGHKILVSVSAFLFRTRRLVV